MAGARQDEKRTREEQLSEQLQVWSEINIRVTQERDSERSGQDAKNNSSSVLFSP